MKIKNKSKNRADVASPEPKTSMDLGQTSPSFGNIKLNCFCKGQEAISHAGPTVKIVGSLIPNRTMTNPSSRSSYSSSNPKDWEMPESVAMSGDSIAQLDSQKPQRSSFAAWTTSIPLRTPRHFPFLWALPRVNPIKHLRHEPWDPSHSSWHAIVASAPIIAITGKGSPITWNLLSTGAKAMPSSTTAARWRRPFKESQAACGGRDTPSQQALELDCVVIENSAEVLRKRIAVQALNAEGALWASVRVSVWWSGTVGEAPGGREGKR
ncbi:hypothetical protein I7I51_08834 [Histoplasma capsulatum]|uniref:Uncharacterized protein n=1 Tax=Ajellomyces capsulatus TaxID=5037 RepID=A0A8A1LZX1_AJECA|nr:hypothetical protein I7I51_08834 [Histoplasma capsulatum]